jgi:hypothetical protein
MARFRVRAAHMRNVSQPLTATIASSVSLWESCFVFEVETVLIK